MGLLSDERIASELERSLWRREGDAIVRDWRLADFAAAMAFVNRVAGLAEAADHHPDILVHGWNEVRLTLTTHSAGGLTEKDFALAAEIDRAARPPAGSADPRPFLRSRDVTPTPPACAQDAHDDVGAQEERRAVE